MATTITRLKTDFTNYSQYDSQRATVNAVAYLATPNAGDVLSVDLVREDGYGVCATQTVTVATNSDKYARLAFVLQNVMDPQLTEINRAKSGFYHVQETGNAAVASPSFTVTLVSVRRMREEICRGLPLLTGETVGPQDQPKLVTGVTIRQCQPDLPQDVYTLTYIHAAGTLSWNGGPAVDITAGGEYTLVDGSGPNGSAKWWVRVVVDDTLLPAADATESVVITEERMTDAQIVQEIQNAQAELTSKARMFLEPTQVATQLMAGYIHNPIHGLVQPTNDYQDRIGMPVTYVRPDTQDRWITFMLPHRGLIELEAMEGFINETEAVGLDRAWWLWNEKSGQIQLVPNQNAIVNWSAYSGFFFTFLMAGRKTLPNFWHYKGTFGLRDLREDREAVRVALEYSAAIKILRQAALHAKPGYTAESLARDGLSQQIAYQKAIYGDTIESYQQWLTENWEPLAQRMRGIQVRIW